MTTWWYVIVLVGLATVGVGSVYYRLTRNGRGGEVRLAAEGAPPDFAQDREDARVARMSDEDRAWESASLARSREARPRDQAATPTG